MIWIRKYSPQQIKEIVGNPLAIKRIISFINNFKQEKKKALLVYGPVGTGKTSALYAIANELNLEIIELNSSDLRNKEEINKLEEALKQRSLFFKGRVILVDEVDNFSGFEDKGGLSEVIKLIGKTNSPIILTANDPWKKSLVSLRKSVDLVEFKPVGHQEISSLLKDICEKENIPYQDKALTTLALRCNGDLRSAIIDLQLLSLDGEITYQKVNALNPRRRMQTIFEILKVILKSKEVRLDILEETDLNLDEVILWIDENLPKEFSGRDLFEAYQQLSKIDIFLGRIYHQQHWRFLSYAYSLTVGLGSGKSPNKAFTNYTRASRILKIWLNNQKKKRLNEILEKLSHSFHCSLRKMKRGYQPYLAFLFKGISDDQIRKSFNLNNEEIDYLRKGLIK